MKVMMFLFQGQHSIFMTVHVTSQLKVHIKNEDEADEFYKVSNGKAKLQVSLIHT